MRIKRGWEFLRLKNYGVKRVTRSLVVYWLKNEYLTARLGISLSKKYADAHERNLFKRRVRECFRQRLAPFESQHDYFIIGRSRAHLLDLAALTKELTYALQPPQ